jgi:EAL domain-containing protein (putative c-di-GMP-specific phosphodiesterase class I)
MGSAAQNTVFDQHRLEATAYRPMVDLASGAISAFEIQQVEEGPEGMVLCGQQPDGLSLARQLAAICAAPLHDMVLALSPAQFVAGPVTSQSVWNLREVLAGGPRLTVLLGWNAGDPVVEGLGDAIGGWRRLGCAVGIDNFGYAPVPALWPLVHRLDLVRIDARLAGMLRAGVIERDSVLALVRFAASLGPGRIVIDGCDTDEDIDLLRQSGATHGQGAHFGTLRRTRPGPVRGAQA